MKKLSLASGLLSLTVAMLAQAPQGISHQAVIRNAANELIANAPIGIQVSILQGSADGAIVYVETHTPTSNASGLISFVIGQGTVVSGVFAEIDWSNGPFFIKTNADPTGGTNYSIEGVSQMLSVPYAFNCASLTAISPNGNIYNVKVNNNGEIFTNITNCPSSVVDIDGNTYNVIAIGNKCWMKENLKTSKYRNGTPIEYPGTSNSAWENNTNGAYALYNNDIVWKDSYGFLYNWLAVNNANELCPTGWHVPSDAEWSQLVDFVISQGFPNSDVTNGAANALKSCRQVNSPLGGDCNTFAHPRWN